MDRNVKVSAIVEKMNLKNLTPEVDYSEKIVEVPDINRPALQLTGYFEHFDAERIQVIGLWNIRIFRKCRRMRRKGSTPCFYPISCRVLCIPEAKNRMQCCWRRRWLPISRFSRVR